MNQIKEKVIEKIKSKGFNVKEGKESDELEVDIGNDVATKLYLNNIVTEANNGNDLDKSIDTRLKMLDQFLKKDELMKKMVEWDFIKDKLIFVLKHNSFCNENLQKKEDNKIYSKPFIQDINIVMAVDLDDSLMYTPKNNVDKWKKSPIEIEDQVIENLKKYRSPYTINKENNFVFIRQDGPNVISPLLVQPRKMREIADENGLSGKEVAGVIPFDSLIVLTESSMNNAMDLFMMASSMIKDKFNTHPISEKLFMVDKEGVISDFRSDDVPGEGVAVMVDKRTGEMHTLPIGRKDMDITGPSAIDMENMVKTDKKFRKPIAKMVLLDRLAEGIKAEEFFGWMMGRLKDEEEVKRYITEMVKKGLMKVRRIDGGFKLFFNEGILKDFFDGGD